MNKRLFFYIFFIIIIFKSSPVIGSNPKAESKRLFNEGIKLFQKGRIEEALDKFHKAYVIYPHWKIRKNIGLCYMKTGENVLALQELNGYLDEGKGELSEKEKESIMEVIFQIMQNVGIIRFYNLSFGSNIVIDGQTNNEASMGKDVYLDPGKHVISVISSNDKIIARQEIFISAGEIKEIDVSTLTKILYTSPEKTSQIPQYKDIIEKKEQKNYQVLHPAIFGSMVAISLAVGLSALGTGINLLVINNNYKDPATPDNEAIKLKEEGQKFQKITNILLGTAGGLAGISVVLFFFTDFKKGKKNEKQYAISSIELHLNPAPGLTFNSMW